MPVFFDKKTISKVREIFGDSPIWFQECSGCIEREFGEISEIFCDSEGFNFGKKTDIVTVPVFEVFFWRNWFLYYFCILSDSDTTGHDAIKSIILRSFIVHVDYDEKSFFCLRKYLHHRSKTESISSVEDEFASIFLASSKPEPISSNNTISKGICSCRFSESFHKFLFDEFLCAYFSVSTQEKLHQKSHIIGARLYLSGRTHIHRESCRWTISFIVSESDIGVNICSCLCGEKESSTFHPKRDKEVFLYIFFVASFGDSFDDETKERVSHIGV